MLLASDLWGAFYLITCYPHGLTPKTSINLGGPFVPYLPCGAPATSLSSPQRMEQMLGAFQSDLSSISSEIRTLQEQSGAMNIRLRNRQAVRGKLGELVDGLIVPSALIT